MSTKAMQARVICETPEQKEWLWLTHRIFNESLIPLIKCVFKMKRGELGPNMQEICNAIFKARNPAQNSFQKLEPITTTKKPWKSKLIGTGTPEHVWADYAKEINESGQILFDRDKLPFAFASEFWRKLCEMTIQLIHGHKELVTLWEEEHGKWIKEKKLWEDENPEYLEVKPILDQFEESVGGKIGKRRGRWHLYLTFLRQHPELAAWRGKESQITDFAAEEEKTLRNRFFRKPGKILEVFLEKNPELRDLDKRNGYYMREFVRPWARRRNPDGFKHRPTFTLPSPEEHPAWYSFKKGATYKDLDLGKGVVSLKVLTSEAGKGRKGEWKPYRFSADPRLNPDYRKQNGLPPIKEIKGIKVMFKGGEPYFVFTCVFEDVKLRVKFEWAEQGEEQGKKRKRRVIPQGLVTCAVDLGVRHLAAATVRKDGKIIRTRFIWLEDATLDHIAHHKRKLRNKRQQRGKPVKGEESLIELQEHTTNIAKDRFKKGARKIVDFARENGADALILENLKFFVPDAERERGINKALIEWNRANLVKWIEMLAADQGIKVCPVFAYYSSRFCSKCGAPGTRYRIVNDMPEREWVGKLFACYECGYRANADHNASVNLHKIFYNEMQTSKNKGNFEYKRDSATWHGKTYDQEAEFKKLVSKWNMEQMRREAPF